MNTIKHNNDDLSSHFNIIRTSTAISNTFLSLLRTVVVLTGVSVLFIKHKKAIMFNTCYISILIFLVIISSVQFYQNSQKLIKLDKHEHLKINWHWQTPLYFSGLLIILLTMLLFVHIKYKI